MSRTFIDLSKNKERNKEKTINLQLSKVCDYALIKYQGKLIQKLFVDLFKDVYMPDYVYTDVTIVKYTDNKYKLTVDYGVYNGKKEVYSRRQKNNYYNNVFLIDGKDIKIMSGGKTKDPLTIKAFYKELFKAEYTYYSAFIKDFEETFCDYDTFITERESYITIIQAYVA